MDRKDIDVGLRTLEHRLSPYKLEAARELYAIWGDLLYGENKIKEGTPKSLNFKINGREYSTVRRLTGAQLEINTTTKKAPEGYLLSTTTVSITDRLVLPGQIVVCALPRVFWGQGGVVPKSEALEAELQKAMPYWGNDLSKSLELGIDFNENDWRFFFFVPSPLKKFNEKSFLAIGRGEIFDNSQSTRKITGVEKINSDLSGHIKVGEFGRGSMSPEMIAIQERMFEKLGVVYVLQEGSSEKQKSGLRNLLPSLRTSEAVK